MSTKDRWLLPEGIEEILPVEAMQRLIEGGVLDSQVAVGPLMNECGNAVAVHGPGGQGPEHEQVECPLHEGEGAGGHLSP